MENKFKKAPINGTMMEVVKYETYAKNPDIYTPGSTAIEVKKGDEEFLLPVRSNTDKRPGMYSYGCDCVNFMKYPKESEKNEYSCEKVIDFSKAKSMGELIEKQNQEKDIEYDILCNPDNIFMPPIDPLDGPEMVGLKEATIAKHIDIDKYQYKFGANYPNDKRQYKKKHATLTMIHRIADKLDMEVQLVFKDKSPNVPNPMGKVVTVSLTGGDEDE